VSETVYAALDKALEQVFEGRRVSQVARRPCDYRTGFALEELDVTFADGETLSVMFKDLSAASLLEDVRRVKPPFLLDPEREIEAYRLLASTRLGAPGCYGAVVEPGLDRYWIFLENVGGVRLWQLSDHALWDEAARWLARLHTSFADRPAASSRLLDYDEAFFRVWPERAATRINGALAEVCGRYDEVVERLAAAPRTLVHGEFYPSNILVEPVPGRVRIAPVDWEMAGRGPGALDLAALTTGAWTDNERDAIVDAYIDELGAGDERSRALRETVDACRLHISFQWLGWAADWAPPAEHAHDWASEAVAAAARLGLL
jgi:aminoglycoside phosphotransferase (APT) family kinase protein